MKIAAVIDLRSPAQVDRYWNLQWRIRLAGNAKAKAAAVRLQEWHRRTATVNVVQMRETPSFLRLQAG